MPVAGGCGGLSPGAVRGRELLSPPAPAALPSGRPRRGLTPAARPGRRLFLFFFFFRGRAAPVLLGARLGALCRDRGRTGSPVVSLPAGPTVFPGPGRPAKSPFRARPVPTAALPLQPPPHPPLPRSGPAPCRAPGSAGTIGAGKGAAGLGVSWCVPPTPGFPRSQQRAAPIAARPGRRAEARPGKEGRDRARAAGSGRWLVPVGRFQPGTDRRVGPGPGPSGPGRAGRSGPEPVCGAVIDSGNVSNRRGREKGGEGGGRQRGRESKGPKLDLYGTFSAEIKGK